MQTGNSKTPIPTYTRRRYCGPAIVDVGSVDTLTNAGGSPVLDNPGGDPDSYWDPNPPSQNAEVELGGR